MTEQDIFLAALEIANPNQRADYLDQACNGKPELRGQVESLLAAHQRSSEFLTPALRQIASRAQPQPDLPPVRGGETSAESPAGNREVDLSFLLPSAKSGSLGRVGHYEVEEVIGRGGCGIVLKAFDERLERVVAIKAMAPELTATSPARKRFLREARAAAAIRHENVIAIYAVEDQPIPFLVMEHIAGQTLQEKLDENGPLDLTEVLLIGQQIARGLEAAHALGLIHRDIKPANILLEKGKDRIKITDFGLARTADDASVTQSGTIAGTPLYMSPEQSLGEPVDPRSDLFSLGSVLYVLCSGRPPFRAPTAMAVLLRVAQEAPRPIKEIIPEVPDWLVAIIGKLHAKQPAERFASAKQVADLLGRCLLELQQKGQGVAASDLLPMSAKPEARVAKSVQKETAAFDKSDALAVAGRSARLRSRRWVAATAGLFALFAGLGLTEATGVTNVRGTVIRLFSTDGVLVVEVDDPAVSVSIDGEDMVITGAGAKEIRLKPGHYKVLASKDGKLVRQEVVTVTKNGRQMVRVSTEVSPLPKVEAPPKSADPDRRAALYALSVGGQIKVSEDGKSSHSVRSAGDLPKTPFVLTEAQFSQNFNAKPTDAGLTAFQGCTGLTTLNLDVVPLTDAALSHFKDCKKLTRLWLWHLPISDTGLAHFKGCKDLRDLRLGGNNMTEDGLVNFKDCTSLTDLWLSGRNVTNAGLAHFKDCNGLTSLLLQETLVTSGLDHLKDCRILTAIDLRDTPATDADLAVFKGRRNVVTLSLDGTAVTDAGLAHFQDCVDLAHLKLDRTVVTDNGLALFANCKALAYLDVSRTKITDTTLARFQQCKKLMQLDVRGTKATVHGVEAFGRAAPTCRILHDGGVMDPVVADYERRAAEWVLTVGGTLTVTGHNGEIAAAIDLPRQAFVLLGIRISLAANVKNVDFARFKDCRSLTSLLLNGPKVGDEGVLNFKDCKKLRYVHLLNTNLTDAGAAILDDCPDLHYLVISGTKITDKALTFLKHPKILTTLDLGSTAVTDAGLVRFQDCEHLEILYLGHTQVTDLGLTSFNKCKNLRDLILNDTKITGAGLANFKDCKELTAVRLFNTKLDDAGLASFKDCSKLASLRLDNTTITDAGLVFLHGCKSLTELEVRKTNVTAKGVEELRKALPRCHIEWDGGTFKPGKK